MRMLSKCDYYFSFKYPPHIKTMANRYILTIHFYWLLSRTYVVFKTMSYGLMCYVISF
nr:MAG TPA: hypothetical protein [Bacteriophage sp.]